MNVWVTLTKRRSKCDFCSKMIETGEWQIVCQYFMPLKGQERTWTKKLHFHAEPNCWLERAKIEISRRPVVENRGRKALQLSDEQVEKRGRILRRRASTIQRINKAMEGGKIDKIEHLVEILEKLTVEIKSYGEVPKSWVT